MDDEGSYESEFELERPVSYSATVVKEKLVTSTFM